MIATRRNLASILTAVLCLAAMPAAAQSMDDLDRLRQRALELTNAARSAEGLSPLRLDGVLTEAAQGHATAMARRDFYGHVAPDGETPFDRFVAAGGSRWSVAGENIARCTGCPPPPDAARIEAFHDGWMQSPGHRENILSPGFDGFGFGIAAEGDRILAVQTFAGPGTGGGASSEGGSESDAAPALSPIEAREAALAEVNARREAEGLDPLERSDALDTVAEEVLKMRLRGEDLPENVFGLLPSGGGGWTRLALRSASRGGSGAKLTRDDVASGVGDWSAEGGGGDIADARVSHLGFAAEARDDGRLTAVAVFGGRD